jgi:nucleoid-associated protein YgaU
MGIGAAVGQAKQAISSLGFTWAKLTVYKADVPKASGNDHLVKRGGKTGEFDFTFNPTELTQTRSAAAPPAATTSGGTPIQAPAQPQPVTYQFTLYYSIFTADQPEYKAPKKPIAKVQEDLLKLVTPAPKKSAGEPTAPPVVQFSWGETTLPDCHVTQLTVKITQFLPSGKPARLEASLTLTEIAADPPGTNPHSGGLAGRQSHTVLAGETLATVAHKELRDPSLWRAIAEENGIDDPMRVRPGTELLIPVVDEL